MASPVGLVRASQPSRLRSPHSSCVKVGGSIEKWEPYDAKVSRTVLREGLELVQPERCCSLVRGSEGKSRYARRKRSARALAPPPSYGVYRCLRFAQAAVPEGRPKLRQGAPYSRVLTHKGA